jgi:hypothetical protein
MSNKERRRLAVERTFSRDVPKNAKIANYVQFVREDRDRFDFFKVGVTGSFTLLCFLILPCGITGKKPGP